VKISSSFCVLHLSRTKREIITKLPGPHNQVPLAASPAPANALKVRMSFKHRHKASDAEELLKGFAPTNSHPDNLERAESASLLSPTSQSSATTVLRKAATTPDSKNERGYVACQAYPPSSPLSHCRGVITDGGGASSVLWQRWRRGVDII